MKTSPEGRGWMQHGRFSDLAFDLLNLVRGKRRPRVPPPASPRAIGVLRTGFIGDLVLVTGMIRELKRRFPAAALHVICYPSARAVAAENPRVQRVWAPEWLPLRRLSALLRPAVLRDMVRFARALRRQKLDLLFVPCRQHTLPGALKVALVTWMAHARVSLGWAYRRRGFYLDVRVPDDGLLVKHEAEWCDDLLRAAGIDGDCTVPDVACSPRHDRAVARKLADLGIEPRHKLIVIHPGGGRDGAEPRWARKRWPARHYAAVARALAESEDARVVITGVDSERSLLDAMRDAGARDVIDLVGRTSLGEFCALARRADVFIGNDSGPTHLAAAVGAPTLAIFGYTDFIGYRPLGPNVRVLRHKVDCAPCLYWFEAQPCRKSYVCLRGVAPERVAAAARDLLAARQPTQEALWTSPSA